MGELVDGNPLFPGENETDQLHCIQKVLGNLPQDQINMFYNNPIYSGKKLIDIQRPETLERRYMGKLNKLAISFMKDLLQLDPKKRLNDDTVFKHPYFADLVEKERGNKSAQNGKRSNRTEENSKPKEHKFYMPSNLSTNSLKKEIKPSTTPLKKEADSSNKHEGNNEGKYDYHSNKGNEGSPPKIPINQTTNINIINISSINTNSSRDKPTPFSILNNQNKNEYEPKAKSKGKNLSKNDLNNLSMPLNNTMISFKTISKLKNPPLTKSTIANTPNESNQTKYISSYNQRNQIIKEADLFKTFFVDQNDKYNFNINTNFDNKKMNKINQNKGMNYNSKNCNVIYEDAEYGRQEPIYHHKNYYSHHNSHSKKKLSYAAVSMYGNFKHKDKGFQLPLINYGKPGGYKK